MKKIIFLIISAFLLPVLTQAAVIQKSLNDNSNTVTSENVYTYGSKDINANGDFKKDFTAVSGETVRVNGSVVGDILSASQNLVVSGDVTGDVRSVAAKVSISGRAGGDVVLAGSDITFATSTIVKGDVLIAGGSVVLRGEIDGRVRIFAESLLIDGILHSGAVVHAGKVVIDENAIIEDPFEYKSARQADIKPGAKVTENIKYTEINVSEKKENRFSPMQIVMTFSVLFIAGLIAWKLFGVIVLTVIDEAMFAPYKRLVIGIVLFIVVPLAALLLCLSVGAMLVGFILGVGLLLLFLLTWAFAPIIVGSFIYKLVRRTPDYVVDWQTILVGSLVLAVVSIIPVVNVLVFALVMFFGIGSLAYSLYVSIREAR